MSEETITCHSEQHHMITSHEKVHIRSDDMVVTNGTVNATLNGNGIHDKMSESTRISHVDSDNNNDPLRVCIIGAGAGGLVCARHMCHDETFKVTIYEQTDSIGGTWCYTDEVGRHSETGQRIHGSMYRNLRTNLPLNIMEFPDFPVRGDNCNFQSHRDVLKYLQEYTEHYDLLRVIKFNHRILHVTRVANDRLWMVKVCDVKTKTVKSELYDCVVVASGRYSVPKMPQIPGMHLWRRKSIIHTHDYRHCDAYTGQTVFVLGAGPSGVDISIEVASVAAKVYLCHTLPSTFKDLDDIMVQVQARVERIDDTCIYLTNGSVLRDVDCIIFATGYKFDLQFLDSKSCNISIDEDNSHINGLYQHLICIAQPSLCIFAVPFQLLPFPLYHQQACFYVAIQKGKYLLPSKEEMEKEEADDLKYRTSVLGFPKRYAHKMTGDLLWKYDDFLSTAAGIKPVAQSKRAIFKYLRDYRQNRTKNYRQLKFIIHSESTFETVDATSE